jgi:hypothetical protein
MVDIEILSLNQSYELEGQAQLVYEWDFQLKFPVETCNLRQRLKTQTRISRKIGHVVFNDHSEFVYKKEYPQGKYSGETRHQKRSGYGIQYFSGEVRYYGHWEDDKPHGEGYLLISKDNYYVGTFVNGQFSGYGEYFLGKDYFYKGNFENNLKHGEGIEKSSKESYQGSFSQGNRHGQGSLKTTAGTYSGHFNQGTPIKGKFRASNRSYTYSGRWKSETWEGKGVLRIYNETSPFTKMKGTFKSGIFMTGQVTTTDNSTIFMKSKKKLF